MGPEVHSLAEYLLSAFHPGEPVLEAGAGADSRTAGLPEGFAGMGRVPFPVTAQAAAARQAEARSEGAHLPDLSGIPDAASANVLCAGALGRIAREDMITAVFSLTRVLRPGGRLVITTPVAPEAPVPLGKLVLLLEATGLMVIESRPLLTRHGEPTAVLLVEKTGLQVARGLERIQSVLVQDRKFATYKFALVRAFCGIARNEPHVVRWGQGHVYVPMWFMARRWLMYYWPFCTGKFVAQRRGESESGKKPIALRSAIAQLAAHFGPGGLQKLLEELDRQPGPYRAALRIIAETIRDGPVTHAGSETTPIFGYARTCPVGPVGAEGQYGWVVVPESVWLDISRFHHWIEDSLILRWAQLTVEMNPGLAVADILPRLVYSPYQERDTGEVRALLQHFDSDPTCVWTGRSLHRGYEVDHVIPFSVWGNNDWWNLMPTDPRVNLNKRDKLPDRWLLAERRLAICAYWKAYYEHVPDLFGRQVERSLGLAVGHIGWERVMFAGFQETVERVATLHGLERWRP